MEWVCPYRNKIIVTFDISDCCVRTIVLTLSGMMYGMSLIESINTYPDDDDDDDKRGNAIVRKCQLIGN